LAIGSPLRFGQSTVFVLSHNRSSAASQERSTPPSLAHALIQALHTALLSMLYPRCHRVFQLEGTFRRRITFDVYTLPSAKTNSRTLIPAKYHAILPPLIVCYHPAIIRLVPPAGMTDLFTQHVDAFQRTQRAQACADTMPEVSPLLILLTHPT